MGEQGITRRRFIGTGMVAGVALSVPMLRTRAAAAAAPVSGPLTAQALGVNTTDYDASFSDPVVPELLRRAGIGRIRYPGGGNADDYDWRATSTSALAWPQFMDELAEIAAAPMITVNYGQVALGPPVAAQWVRSALTFPNYSSATAVWVIGNEEYGPWETDQHPNPHTPDSYATFVRPYFEAMHAVDPATRVGFPMTIARTVAAGTGTWVADPDLWNRTVLGRNVDQVDFIDFHWYPIFGIPVLSNAELFQTVQRIPGALAYLQGILDAYGSKAPIVVSESNISQSEIVYNVQPVAALYAAATALTFLSHGAQSYMWWQVHNSDNMDGDFGFLSSATGTPGPSSTTITAPVAAGARSLVPAGAEGFFYGHRFTIGTGSRAESRKITALPGTTTLAAPAAPGQRNAKVAETSTLTTSGATTAYHQLFAPGTPVSIGTESNTVVSVGSAAGVGTLAAPAAAGERTVRIVGIGAGGQTIPVFMPPCFVPGAVLTIAGDAGSEEAQIATVGTSSSLGTTTVAPIAAGDQTIYVESVADTSTGVANYVGDPITIDTGDALEVRTITAVGVGAAAPTTLLTAASAGQRTVSLASTAGVTVGHPLLVGEGDSAELTSPVISVGAPGTGSGSAVTLADPLTRSQPAGATALDVGSGITVSAPLSHPHPNGVPARDAGTGLLLTAPLARSHASGSTVSTPGTGLQLAAPLRQLHPAGASITSNAITFTPALAHPHAAGTTISETGLAEPPLDTPLPAYWGFVLSSKLARPGARVVMLTSPSPSVLAYASYQQGGVSLMLINTDDSHSAEVKLDGPAQQWSPPARRPSSRPDPLSAQPLLTSYDYSLERPEIIEGAVAGDQLLRGIQLRPESIKVLTAEVTGVSQDLSIRTVRRM